MPLPLLEVINEALVEVKSLSIDSISPDFSDVTFNVFGNVDEFVDGVDVELDSVAFLNRLMRRDWPRLFLWQSTIGSENNGKIK